MTMGLEGERAIANHTENSRSARLVRNLLSSSPMLASALVAYLLGPFAGFTFAVVVGSLCGWAFAFSVVGRGAELERRWLVHVGPFADRLLALALDPLVAWATMRVLRSGLLSPARSWYGRATTAIAARVRGVMPRRAKLDPDAAIDFDLELETIP